MEEFAKALGLRPDKRTTLVIDGPALYRAERKIDFVCDYKALHTMIDETSDLHHASYFTGITEAAANGEREHNPLVPLIDWLGWNGFRCHIKRAFPFVDSAGMQRVRCNLQSDITVEMLSAAECCDTIILFSDNSDLEAALLAVQRKNCRVTLVAFNEETDSDFLKLADRSVKLEKVYHLFSKKKNPSQPRTGIRRTDASA